MTDIFDVIADATRRDILGILVTQQQKKKSRTKASREMPPGTSVSHIVDGLGVSQPTVSKHLKVLRDVGLVTVEEKGQHRYYSLDVKPFRQLEAWLLPFLDTDGNRSRSRTPQNAENVLSDESRAFAKKIGNVAADTTFHVDTIVDAAQTKPWRKKPNKR